MRIASCIPKAKNTHSQNAILTAFPLQQRLHERAPTLRYSTLPVKLRIIEHNFINNDERIQKHKTLTFAIICIVHWVKAFPDVKGVPGERGFNPPPPQKKKMPKF
jgi:hypothetical protein